MYILRLVKKFLAPVIAFLSYMIFVSPTSAAGLIDCNKIQDPFKILCNASLKPENIIGAAISFIFVIGVIIAIFYLLLGAVKWIYSGGDKAAIEGARGTITAAIVGLVVLFLVFLIFTILLNFFGFGIEEITNIPAITP